MLLKSKIKKKHSNTWYEYSKPLNNIKRSNDSLNENVSVHWGKKRKSHIKKF